MGWTFYNRTPADERAEIDRLLTWDNEHSAAQVLDARKVGSTWYAAVKMLRHNGTQRDYVTDLDGSYTFCAVILTKRSGGEWGYKDMCETSGPAECKCPALILKLLSPLTDPNGYAAQWRKDCGQGRKSAAQSFKVGDRLRLATRPTLGGQVVEVVTVETYQRRGRNMRAYRAEGVGLFRMDSSWLAGAERIA